MNNNPSYTLSGILTEEISDYFITFTIIKNIKLIKRTLITKARDFSINNKNN
jgi:hypothetical protein